MNLLNEGIIGDYVKKTDLTRKLTIDGITDIYPVYKVKLDYLFYNDQNDRIATWISQYKAEHGITKLDMTDFEAYNNIIEDFIIKSNPEAIKNTRLNIELVDQREPGVVLADGRIIDGNRRFTCLRKLKEKNLRFNYFETVILEKNLENNAKQIKMLELMIQHGEESKVDYNPIDRLVGIYNDIVENKLLTNEEYRISTNISPSELNRKIELAKLLAEFLEMINAPKQFHIARDMDLDGPLNELYGILKKINDEEQKENMKNAVFVNFLMQPHPDMTRFTRRIKAVTAPNCIGAYLDNQMEIAERVIDKLPKVGSVNNKVINEVFRSDNETKKELENSLDKAETKAKSYESRTRPAQMLEKVGDVLETIDTNIFRKLDEEQISAIVTQIDKVQELLDIIREATNV